MKFGTNYLLQGITNKGHLLLSSLNRSTGQERYQISDMHNYIDINHITQRHPRTQLKLGE